MTEHNPYRMPFLLRAEKAARLIARAIERRRRFYVLPWQMALVGRVLRVLPRPLYDAVFARAPRSRGAPAEPKPRAGRRPAHSGLQRRAQAERHRPVVAGGARGGGASEHRHVADVGAGTEVEQRPAVVGLATGT